MKAAGTFWWLSLWGLHFTDLRLYFVIVSPCFQTVLQEVLSHKRIIESLLDKSKSLPQINNDQALEKAIVSVNKRYEDLVDGILKTISQLEESLDIFQQFQQLQKAYQEDLKQLWDKLSSLTGKEQVLDGGIKTKSVEITLLVEIKFSRTRFVQLLTP